MPLDDAAQLGWAQPERTALTCEDLVRVLNF
jgi:hypothetical protein